MIDSHSHSSLSHDGKFSLEEMRAQAESLGLEYFAVTEHLDRDYKFGIKEKFVHQLNLNKYEREFNRVKSLNKDSKMYYAFGVEAGYSEKAIKIYEKQLQNYPFDVVINSIHTLDGHDAYFPTVFNEHPQDVIYNRYLDLLIESLDVPYHYDIIGHIGYISRYAPYPNPSLYQPQYLDKLDTFLKKVIEKDKTIEINTHIRDNPLKFLPEVPILKRYFALGGRNITFSSDAHRLTEIGSRYELVLETVKEIGFNNWIVYKNSQKNQSKY